MRAIVQRVKRAKVIVGGKVVAQIGKGFLVLLGVSQEDTEKEVDWLVEKVCNLRIMSDEKEKMNKSLKEVGGKLLVVSQFTLYGDCLKGRRPSFIKAAKPEKAKKLYNLFIQKAKDYRIKVEAGIFGAMMAVELVNDGPVTLIIER